MKLIKLFTLMFLLVGIWSIDNGSVRAAAPDSCQEQSDCLNQATADYEACENDCPPFASCYYQCSVRRDQAETACYENFPCP